LKTGNAFLKKVSLLVLVMLFAAVTFAGCAPPEEPPAEEPPEEETNEIHNDEEAVEESQVLRLYFSDDQAEHLVTEEREIKAGERGLMVSALEALIKGPEDPDLVRTIPESTEVLGVEMSEGVAEVNFSEEIRSDHWGGSAGERMTVMSVTHTLVGGFEEVEQVKFLIEGEEIETLVGHMDLRRPVTPEL